MIFDVGQHIHSLPLLQLVINCLRYLYLIHTDPLTERRFYCIAPYVSLELSRLGGES